MRQFLIIVMLVCYAGSANCWFIGKIVDTVKDAAKDVGDAAKDAAKDVGDAVGDAAGNVGDAASNVGDAIGDTVDHIDDVVDNVGDAVGDVADKVDDAIGDAVDNVGDAVDGAVDNVKDTVDDVVDSVKDVIKDVADAAEDALREFVEFIGDSLEALKKLIDSVVSNVEDTVDEVKDKTEEIFEDVTEVGKKIKDEIEDKVGEIENLTEEITKLVTEEIKEKIGLVKTMSKDVLANTKEIKGLVDGIASKSLSIPAIINKLVGFICNLGPVKKFTNETLFECEFPPIRDICNDTGFLTALEFVTEILGSDNETSDCGKSRRKRETHDFTEVIIADYPAETTPVNPARGNTDEVTTKGNTLPNVDVKFGTVADGFGATTVQEKVGTSAAKTVEFLTNDGSKITCTAETAKLAETIEKAIRSSLEQENIMGNPMTQAPAETTVPESTAAKNNNPVAVIIQAAEKVAKDSLAEIDGVKGMMKDKVEKKLSVMEKIIKEILDKVPSVAKPLVEKLKGLTGGISISIKDIICKIDHTKGGIMDYLKLPRKIVRSFCEYNPINTIYKSAETACKNPVTFVCDTWEFINTCEGRCSKNAFKNIGTCVPGVDDELVGLLPPLVGAKQCPDGQKCQCTKSHTTIPPA